MTTIALLNHRWGVEARGLVGLRTARGWIDKASPQLLQEHAARARLAPRTSTTSALANCAAPSEVSGSQVGSLNTLAWQPLPLRLLVQRAVARP